MDVKDLVVLGVDGAMTVADPDLKERLSSRAGYYRMVVEAPGLLMMRRDADEKRPSPRVLMAGEIINRMTVMEVINVIATSNWHGELSIFGPDATRILVIEQGVLKEARSNDVADRIGEVMYRSGLITRMQLGQLLHDLSPKERLGELAVRKGYLDQAQLFTQLQKQAEEVCYAALLMGEGHYVFSLPTEGDGEDAEFTTPVHIPVHHLLMEGVQRIDEMALFRDKIPSDELVPQIPPDPPEKKKLEDVHEKVLSFCDGNRTIEDIARDSGLGDFATVKALYHLLQQKQVTLGRGKRVNADAVRRLVNRFNDIMQDIFFAVATYGGLAQARATVDAWIHGSGYAPYFGPGVDEFGAVDSDHVVQALAQVDIESPLEALHQALHELTAFALFSATTTLPRDQELTLARDVNARLRHIRPE